MEAETQNQKIKQIFIIGEIGSDANRDTVYEMVSTDWEDVTDLFIYICSDGGYLRDCFSIIDMVQTIKRITNIKITTFAMGEVASAGFFLFLLGDVRIQMPNCQMFVHEHITIDNEQTYSERIRADKTHETESYNMYVDYTSERLGITKTRAKKLLKLNKWLTKKEIEHYGIVSEDSNEQYIGQACADRDGSISRPRSNGGDSDPEEVCIL